MKPIGMKLAEMNAFALHLCGAVQNERIDEVVSFVGEDASGAFGIQPGHARFMTALVFGLARAHRADGSWEYFGIPGGVLYFNDGVLRVSTRRYLRDTDPGRILTELTGNLLQEEQALADTRRKLRVLEAHLLHEMEVLEGA